MASQRVKECSCIFCCSVCSGQEEAIKKSEMVGRNFSSMLCMTVLRRKLLPRRLIMQRPQGRTVLWKEISPEKATVHLTVYLTIAAENHLSRKQVQIFGGEKWQSVLPLPSCGSSQL